MRFIELFAGIGGFRLGLEKVSTKSHEGEYQAKNPRCGIKLDPRQKWEQASYQCVWANDNDKYACQIYRRQFGIRRNRSSRPKHGGSQEDLLNQQEKSPIKKSSDTNYGEWECLELYEGDIRTVDSSAIPEHDLICAGFPCQSFSIAGKRGGFEDTRGTLFFEICRIARAKRTKYLFLENVKGLLSHDNGDTFQTIIRTLDELGYDCQWQVLNSKDYGVPQNRERVFIIGHIRGQSRPKVFPIGEADQAYPKSDERGSQVSPTRQDTQPRNGYPQPASRNSWFNSTLDEDISTAIDANYGKEWLDHGQRTMIFKYGVIGEKNKKWLDDGKDFSRNFPQGQRVYSVEGISAQLNAQGGGWGAKTGLYEVPMALDLYNKRGHTDRTPALTEPHHNTLRVLEQGRIRRLTPIECERLQGFPDNWTEGISDTQRYKCLGNAVTTNVITEIGLRLL